MHELLHTLGLYHEQSRNDRDDYITINTENIRAGESEEVKQPDDQLGRLRITTHFFLTQIFIIRISFSIKTFNRQIIQSEFSPT